MLSIWPLVSVALKVGALVFVATVLLHAFVMVVLSRRVVVPAAGPTPTPRVVFLVPCLNEAAVIAASLDRLLTLPYEDLVVVVIDDGSDDDTAAIVSAYHNPQVRLLRRVLPEARTGKGDALNAAYRIVSDHVGGDAEQRHRTIVGVLDADGFLSDNALTLLAGPESFGDRQSGAVQLE